jgi:glycerol-3-phosphate dehydrogenase
MSPNTPAAVPPTSPEPHAPYDLLVVGGGINGVGIALDAAGRGLKVLLCEMHDLASATSSNSSKLIHGGLRYLEHYEFRLVRESLAEREVLLKKAPHIMQPLRFRLPHRPHLRPAWMIRLGLFFYDHLAKRATLKGSQRIRFGSDSPLHPHITTGFEYSDLRVDDARLVVLNAMAARDLGAVILPHTQCVQACRAAGLWQATLRDQSGGSEHTLQARALVNAAGPWVTDFYEHALAMPSPRKIRLVKGSHVIVPKIHHGAEAYILQNEDQRIVFVIPYEEHYSLIGTTDVEYQGSPSDVSISTEEISYLLTISNQHFNHQLTAADVISTYAGVRPLQDDDADSPQSISRDYTFELQTATGDEASAEQAPLLTVFGGKLTTYRKLAEAALKQLAPYFPEAGPAWTATAPLPGGDLVSQPQLLAELQRRYPWLRLQLAQRFVHSYGTLSHRLLHGVGSLADMGMHFGAGLYQREVEYLMTQEWARSADDIVRRRSKLYLALTEAECAALEAFMQSSTPR